MTHDQWLEAVTMVNGAGMLLSVLAAKVAGKHAREAARSADKATRAAALLLVLRADPKGRHHG